MAGFAVTTEDFGKQKLNLHQRGNEFEPKANAPTPGAVDLCFITETSIEDVRRELEAKGVPVELGPVTQVGALGKMFSVYLRDPDRNLIEIANYVPE
jgi:catechol 2,3-dioxygenase-like lactoylglutathione lyase family enzyme